MVPGMSSSFNGGACARGLVSELNLRPVAIVVVDMPELGRDHRADRQRLVETMEAIPAASWSLTLSSACTASMKIGRRGRFRHVSM